ncbi:MAG: alpha-amylase family glycosyl hydrolase, partial [Verrucomicrobiota bacterium]
MKSRINTFLIALALFLSCGTFCRQARGEVMLQYFNTSWNEITNRIPELAEAGYSALWLPPPFKAGGVLDVGYDTYDRFDYGGKENPINHTIATKYGTAADLLRLMETAHRFGLRVYFDNVMAHNGGPIPGYDQYTPITIQTGFVPEDFHLQARPDGTYRQWSDSVDYSNA